MEWTSNLFKILTMIQEQQILHEILGVKYVLVSCPVINGDAKRFDAAIAKFKCIFQGIEKVHQSFWATSYVLVKVLVPEQEIFEFQKTIL